jgi:2'-5' RNA ligase
MNPEVYKEIWQTFINGDHISQASIWGGEGLALIIPVDAPKVLKNIELIQETLKNSLPFYPHLLETLHITVFLFGKPPESYVPVLETLLRPTLVSVPAFQVELKNINSFFRAPFLEVHDKGNLNNLYNVIEPGLKKMGFSGMDYGPRGQVWHLILGKYSKSDNGSAARKLLMDLHHQSAGFITVSELRLVKTSEGTPYRMKTLRNFPLLSTSRPS